ncbi:MAG: hypothetical protein WBA25_17120 [Jannaschia sp.]
MTDGREGLSCPSAQPETEGAQVLGVVDGERLSYVNARVPVTPEVLEAAGPVPPTQLFRFAAPCATATCTHFEGGACRLATRIATRMAPVVDRLPACVIRPTCRWHAQEGAAACHRCPQVVTRIAAPDSALQEIASDVPG